MFIWSDKIVISNRLSEVLEKEYLSDNNSHITQITKTIYPYLVEHGLLTIINPEELISKEVQDYIDKQADIDFDILPAMFPETIKHDSRAGVPKPLIIEDIMLCKPMIQSIYIDLLISKNLNLQCLFSKDIYLFSKYKFSDKQIKKTMNSDLVDSFSSIIEAVSPNTKFVNICWDCRDNCTEYLKYVSKEIARMFEFRNQDEVLQVKNKILYIINILKEDNSVNPIEVQKMFFSEANRLNARIKKMNPAIINWDTHIMMISSIVASFCNFEIPTVAKYGLSFVNMVIALTDYWKKLFIKNNKWVSFVCKKDM